MIRLETIIKEYYIESLGMTQLDERFPRFLQIAISGIKDLNQDIRSVVTEKLLTVNSNDTVDLPDDYIDYIVIGVIKNGVIESLGLNNNVGLRPLDDCGDITSVVKTDSTNRATSFESFYTLDGESSGRNYGLGGAGNANGSYKIYKDSNYIALTNFTGTEIILRYLSSIRKVDGKFLVEPYLVEAIKAWMYWKYIQRMRSYGVGEKRDAENTYKKEKLKADRRVKRFNIPEFMSAYKSGYRSSPAI